MFIFAIFEIQISGDGLSRFMKLFTDSAVFQGDDEFSFRFAKRIFNLAPILQGGNGKLSKARNTDASDGYSIQYLNFETFTNLETI